jgi:hypothetical protein
MRNWAQKIFSRLRGLLIGLPPTEREVSDFSSPGKIQVSVSTSTGPRRGWNLKAWPGIFIDAFRSNRIAQLEHDLQEQRERSQLLEGQLMAMRSQTEYLREQAEQALSNERIVYQTGLNVDFQRKYGFALFPNAPHIPISAAPVSERSVVGGHASIRSLQEEQTAKFREAWSNKFEGTQ